MPMQGIAPTNLTASGSNAASSRRTEVLVRWMLSIADSAGGIGSANSTQGFANPASASSITLTTTRVNPALPERSYLNLATSAAASSFGHWSGCNAGGTNTASTIQHFCLQGLKFIRWRAGLGQTTGTRCFIGLTDQTGSTVNPVSNLKANTPPGNFVGFRFCNGAGDTTWSLITVSGSVLTNRLNSGVAPDTALHDFMIVCSAGGTIVQFYIDDVLVGTVSSGLPSATQGFCDDLFIDAGGAAAVVSANINLILGQFLH